MIKRIIVILSPIIVVALLSGIGFPFGIPPAATAGEEEKYPDNIDITRLHPYEKREKIYPQLSSDLDRLVEAEELGERLTHFGVPEVSSITGELYHFFCTS